jgi:hypothetical protein
VTLSGKQGEYLVFQERIIEHLGDRQIAVDDFVNLSKTLPQCIILKDFDGFKVVNGEHIPVEIPNDVSIDGSKFPILAVITAEELLTFSPATEEGFSLSQSLYGVPEAVLESISGITFKMFLSDEEKYKSFVFTRISNDYADGKLSGITGSPAENYMARLAALRLHELTQNYLTFRSQQERLRAFVTLGDADDAEVTRTMSLLASKLKRWGLYRDQQQIADLLMFGSFGASQRMEDFGWKDFEKECAAKLSGAGFNVEYVSEGHDFGADIVCSKSGLTYVLQCKWHTAPIGIRGVQEAATALRIHEGDYALVVADSGFTNAAHEAARKNNVALISTSQLQRIDQLFV